MNDDISFGASWDGFAKWVTVLVTGTGIALLLTPLFHLEGAVLSLVGILLLLISGLTWLWAPTGYRLGPSSVVVTRPASNVEIAYDDIAQTEVVDGRETLRGAIRTFGDGGLWGYYGAFWSRKLGTFRIYARRLRGPLVLFRTTAGRTIVLAPTDPDLFLAELTERREVTQV